VRLRGLAARYDTGGDRVLQVKPAPLTTAGLSAGSTRDRAAWTVGILAVTQIVSWGSLYYAFSILAPTIARELRLSTELVYGAYSVSLLVAGLAAAPVGILIDRHGGRLVMSAGSVLAGIAVYWLSRAESAASLYGAWILLGVAMAATLYEAAFAVISRRHGDDARRAISTLTLFAGFASTVFWPLTLYLSSELGWRSTYACYALLQIVLCVPLHLLLRDAQRSATARAAQRRSHTLGEALRHPTFWLLAVAFAVNTLVFSTLTVHLIPLLTRMNHPIEFAVLAASLIGPTQVAGRVLERSVADRISPETVGKLTFCGLPVALAILVFFGEHGWAVALFCTLYGASNGILTIVRATIPRSLFGPENYGAISGALAGPAMLSKAVGPVLAAWVLHRHASGTALLGGLLLLSVLSLLLLGMSLGSHRAEV
jgi:predicted MFS family arabinose efflux permease